MSADWFWETDGEQRVTWLAGGAPMLRLLGDGLAAGRRLWEIAGVEADPQALKAHLNLLGLQLPFTDFELRRKDQDGTVRVHLVSGEPRHDAVGKCIGYRGVGHDVTEKRLAERALQETKEQLELALEGGELAFWDSDLGAGTIYLSAGWARVIDGAPANRSIAHAELLDYVHPDDRREFFARSLGVLRGIAPSFEQELRVRAANGDWRWIYAVGRVAARDASGRVTRVLGIAANVERRKRAELQLRDAEERYRRLSEFSPNGILVTSNGLVEYANPAAAKIFRAGSPRRLVGMRFDDLIHPDEVAYVEQRRRELRLAPGQTQFVDRRVRTLDGAEGTVIEGAAVSYFERGRLLIQIAFRDVTEARKAHAALAERERRFRDVVEASGEYVWETDAAFRYTYLSVRAEAILGFSRGEMLGRRPREFMPLDETRTLDEWFARHVREGGPFRDLVHRSLTKGGRTLWQSVSGVPVYDEQGRLQGYRGTGADITSRKQAEERAQYLATRDALTGLPNRTLLADRAGQAIAHAARRRMRVALFMLDLNAFRAVNDSHGYPAGDRLLCAVAERLARVVREEDTLARLNGNEYALLWGGLRSMPDIETVAKKILASFVQPFAVGEAALHISASLGIAVSPDHAADFHELLRCADIALRQAKLAGAGKFRFFAGAAAAEAVPIMGAGRRT